MKSKYVVYVIWFCYHSKTTWSSTGRTFLARTDKEAQARVKRRYANADFTSMSVLALPEGQVPNSLSHKDQT